MKKFLIFFLASLFLVAPVASAKSVSDQNNFQAAVENPSPLSPPDRFVQEIASIEQSGVYKKITAQQAAIAKMKNSTADNAQVVRRKDLIIALLEDFKNLISSRSKMVEAKIKQEAQDRLEALSVAIQNDYSDALVLAETNRAAAIARADVDKRTATIVNNVKAKTSISILRESIASARARLKQPGLTPQARRKLVSSIITANNQVKVVEKERDALNLQIAADHQNKLNAAESQLRQDEQLAEEIYNKNITSAEAAVATEEAAAIASLVQMTEKENGQRNSIRTSCAKHLTRLLGRSVSLGGEYKPPKPKPSKPKVGKKQKDSFKKKARNKARQIGKKRLREYREAFSKQR